MAEPKKQSSSLLVAVAWAVVSVPLIWGIYNTSLNAAKLFTAAPAGAQPSARPLGGSPGSAR